MKIRLHVEQQRHSTLHVNLEHAIEPVGIQLDSEKLVQGLFYRKPTHDLHIKR